MKNKYLELSNYLNKASFYWNKIYHEPFYNKNIAREDERKKFLELGFNYDEALEKMNNILHEMGKPDFESQEGMGSIHWLIFCCIEQVAQIKNILEIGTFDGETALLLSKIFPNSLITTLDLPPNDPIFEGSYYRDDQNYREKFIRKRNENISSPQIKYIESNSFFLLDVVEDKFDLIWVDAGHLYPEVSWDICNAYHLCKKQGWLMCDDIIKNKKGLRNHLVSPDSYEILDYVDKRTEDEINYFLKRESPAFSANPRIRKYVSVLQKS